MSPAGILSELGIYFLPIISQRRIGRRLINLFTATRTVLLFPQRTGRSSDKGTFNPGRAAPTCQMPAIHLRSLPVIMFPGNLLFVDQAVKAASSSPPSGNPNRLTTRTMTCTTLQSRLNRGSVGYAVQKTTIPASTTAIIALSSKTRDTWLPANPTETFRYILLGL